MRSWDVGDGGICKQCLFGGKSRVHELDEQPATHLLQRRSLALTSGVLFLFIFRRQTAGMSVMYKAK